MRNMHKLSAVLSSVVVLAAASVASAQQTLTSDPFTMTFRVGNAPVPGGYTLPGNVMDASIHVDIGFPVVNEGGQLEFESHWHQEVPTEIEFEPSDAYGDVGLQVNRPAGSQWDFVGVIANAPFYHIRNTPATGGEQYPYLGWATEESQDQLGDFSPWNPGDPRANTAGQWTKLSLLGVTGPDGSQAPGVFSMWETDGFGNLTLWMSSQSIDASDALFVDGAVHVHKSVGFSAAGIYELTFQASTQVIPEPATLTLLSIACGGLLTRRRR
jgi:surface-anchored protein